MKNEKEEGLTYDQKRTKYFFIGVFLLFGAMPFAGLVMSLIQNKVVSFVLIVLYLVAIGYFRMKYDEPFQKKERHK